jgi:hypothetical protein
MKETKSTEEILLALIQMKKHKDSLGKTAYYLENQPATWEEAFKWYENKLSQLSNSDQNDAVSDTTGDDSSTEAGKQKTWKEMWQIAVDKNAAYIKDYNEERSQRIAWQQEAKALKEILEAKTTDLDVDVYVKVSDKEAYQNGNYTSSDYVHSQHGFLKKVSLSSLNEKFLLHLIDTVWNECTESKEVPSTIWAKQMIGKAKESFGLSSLKREGEAKRLEALNVIEECLNDAPVDFLGTGSDGKGAEKEYKEWQQKWGNAIKVLREGELLAKR